MQKSDWVIPFNEITIYFDKILGKGEFNIIYKGRWRGLEVAIKYFNKSCNENLKIHLQREINILTKLHHPNIIQILGVSFEPLLIVLEYMKDGNLSEHIMKMRYYPTFYIYKKKFDWCRQIVLALYYLHDRKPEQIIHRDLKPFNILVSNNQIKLSDFGVSKIMIKSDNLDLTNDIGTYTYMAPEMMKKSIYNYKVDIYALGLIFFEIWENRRWFSQLYINNFDDLKRETMLGIRLHFYYTPTHLRQIINSCISMEPGLRPDAKQIIEQMTSAAAFK